MTEYGRRLRGWWTAHRERYKALATEYGGAFVAVQLCTFVVVLVAFYLAVNRGYQADSVEGLGTLGLAYVLTKATQPLRIAFSALVVPFVVRARRRVFGV